MHKITVMGTSDRLESLKNKEDVKIVLRTGISDAAEVLKSRGVVFETLDFVYDIADDFDKLDDMLADELIKILKESHVLYIVPGSAVSGDGSVRQIALKYDNVEISAGDAPEYDVLAKVLEADASSGYATIPAACMQKGMFSPRLPLIITAVDNSYLAADIKILLCEEYGDEHLVFAGKKGFYAKHRLYELDRLTEFDHNFAIYIPPKSESARYDLFELEEIFKKLRSPGGCPWDREQTHESLKRYLMEECAEVLDAISNNDMHELMEELGDVLLQIYFHATIAAERGDFDMRDVSDTLARKLIKRHPHVFGDSYADNPEAVLKQWDEIKSEDKQDKSVSAKLKSVPRSMPALMRVQKVLSRVAKSDAFIDKVGNLKSAYDKLASDIAMINTSGEIPKGAIGELLFDVVDFSRMLGFEAELILNDELSRYIDEFEKNEKNNNH